MEWSHTSTVLMPVEEQWRMMLPDFKGDPHFYKVREGAMDGFPVPNN